MGLVLFWTFCLDQNLEPLFMFVCFCNVIGDAGGGKQQKKNGAAGEGRNRIPLFMGL